MTQVPRDLADEARSVEPKFSDLVEVLEPRILLDANLGLDFSGLDNVQIIEAMNVLLHEVEDQFDLEEANNLVNTLREKLGDAALDGADDIFSLEPGQELTGRSEFEDIFERVRLAGMQIVEEFREDLDRLVQDNLPDIEAAIDDLQVPPPLGTAAQDQIDEINNLDEDYDYLTFGTAADPALDTQQYGREITPVYTEVPPDTGDYVEDASEPSGYRAVPVGTGTHIEDPPGSGFFEPAPPGPGDFEETSPGSGEFQEVTTGTGTHDRHFELGGYGSWDFVAHLKNTESVRNQFLGPVGVWEDGYEEQVRDFVEGLRLKTGTQTIDPATGDLTNGSAVDFDLSAQTKSDLTEHLIAWGRKFVSENDTTVTGNLADIKSKDYLLLNGEQVSNLALQKPDDPSTPEDESAGNPAPVGPFDLEDYFTDQDRISEIIGSRGLWDDNVAERIDIYFDRLELKTGTVVDFQAPEETDLTDVPLDDETKAYLKSIFLTGLNKFLKTGITSGELSDLQDIDLDNVKASSGDVLIGYEQVGAQVEVSVSLPVLSTIFNDLDVDPALRTILPIDFKFPTAAETMKFRLTTQTESTGSGASLEKTGKLSIGQFELESGALFQFGDEAPGEVNRQIDGTNLPEMIDLPKMSAGLLTAQLTSIEMANFGVFLGGVFGDATASFGHALEVTASAAGGAPTVDKNDTTGTGFGFEFQVDALDQTTLVTKSLSDTGEIAFLRYNLAADLPIVQDFSDGYTFEASLTQSISLNEVRNQGADPDTTGLRNSTVEIDADASTLRNVATGAATVPAQFNQIVEELYLNSTDTLTGFLSGIGDSVAGLLNSSDFSAEIPLTDFDLADAFEATAEFFEELPLSFKISPSDLGFGEKRADGFSEDEFSNVTLTPEVTEVDGVALDIRSIEALAELGSLTFDFYEISDDDVLGAKASVEVDLSALDSHLTFGTVEDPDAFLADFAATVSTALADAGYGWQVVVADRALRFMSYTAPLPVLPGTGCQRSSGSLVSAVRRTARITTRHSGWPIWACWPSTCAATTASRC